MRLLFGAVLRDLMEHQERAADGRAKKRPLLLLLDEFPQLGKLDLFEQSMGAMAGYGVRAFIVTQSLHQVTQAYGRYHTILDNCQIVTSFAATDVETAETVSKLAGDIYEMRPQETWSGKRQIFGLDHRAITYREERRPLILPAEVRRLPERDELVFVTGAKPLKAQKLRYDEEPIFASRLFPLPETEPRAPLPTPWAQMRSLGLRDAPPPTLPQTAQPQTTPGRDAAIAHAVARQTPLRSRPRPTEQQSDLFALIAGDAAAQSSEPEPASAPPPPAPARASFDLRPREVGDNTNDAAEPPA
jgi:type IV secretion system protein VirD4